MTTADLLREHRRNRQPKNLWGKPTEPWTAPRLTPRKLGYRPRLTGAERDALADKLADRFEARGSVRVVGDMALEGRLRDKLYDERGLHDATGEPTWRTRSYVADYDARRVTEFTSTDTDTTEETAP